MRIRTQLTALAAGVMAPLVLLLAFVTYSLWHQQRQAYEQRFLERVSALRLALDTELEGILGALSTAAGSTDLSGSDVEATFQRRFGRLLANYPGWSAVAVTDTNGRALAQLVRAGAPAPPLLQPSQIRGVIQSGEPFFSGVERGTEGALVTYIVVPVLQGMSAQGVVYAIIEHAHWLSFLKTYPISPQATLTLNDRQGMIIARTLNDERWAGKRSTTSYLNRTAGKDEDSFQSTGLEGQGFYTAFSRSRRAGWLLATGVPRADVETALLRQTLMVVISAAFALAGAFAAAWLLSRHIHKSLTSLQASASSWPSVNRQADTPLPIAEAETVRLALAESGKRMLSHEQALTAAVEREASAREAAESGSRAKDAFLAMLGHELRNPLSAITTATAVLSSPTVTPAAAAKTRDILSRQTAHLRKMLGDLIDTAELTRGNVVLQTSRIDLAKLVDRVVARFTDSGRCSHLQLNLNLQPAFVEADEGRLEQALSHLLENACEYTPSNGRVDIEVRSENGSAILEVSDTGPGIAPQLIGHVFDMFAQGQRTVDRSQGGLGLGLTVTKQVVELHHGSIEVSSRGVGLGSVFTVRLPDIGEEPAALVPVQAKQRLRLTIVEDAPDGREVMVLLLSTGDRLVNVGEDGPSGVAAILLGPSDVALVDIGLPGFDGLEVARRVRQAPGGRRILLFALTGYGTAEDRKKALAAGFDDLFVKPFDPDHFEARLAAGLKARGFAGQM